MAGLWSVALRAVLRAFAELGVDSDELCRRCDLDPAWLADPDGRVPLARTGRLWPEGTRLFGRPGLGLHAGVALRFGLLEALDYAFATSTSVAHGLERVARYFDVVTGGATRMRVERRGAELALAFFPMPIDDLRDYGVAVSVRRLRWAGVTARRVTLRGAPVAAPEAYVEALGCPVTFEADASAVVIGAADGERPMPTSLPGLTEIVERELGRVLAAALDGRDPLDDVRREVLAALGPEPPALSDVARRLGVSDRTLQRRLAERKTRFKDVVDETRLALALDQLARDQRSVSEIAFLLGYSEPSAFSRAFHRWTGEWPAEYRARERGRSTSIGSA